MFKWYFDKKRENAKQKRFSNDYFKKDDNHSRAHGRSFQKTTVDILIDGEKIKPGDPRYKEAIKSADQTLKDALKLLTREAERLNDMDDLFDRLFKD